VTEAILLVGGYGTRLKPLTIHTPKPMLEVAGFPVTSHQISKAKAAGIDHIVLGTAFKAEVFREGLGDGSKLGVKISYAYEPEQLGTGGGIRNAAELLTCGPEDPVVVFNGDVLTGVDINKVLSIWKEKKADVALYLTKVDNPAAYGSVPTDAEGNVLAFLEKPERKEDIVTDQINAGMYIFKRKVIDTIATGRVVSVEREVFPNLLKAG
jgi:mannose-1-phosphate guanylyltransferase